MNRKQKLLPQLNQLFMQRQSYNSHRKKILQIRKKKPQPKIRQQINSILNRSPTRQASIRESKITSKSKQVRYQLKKIPPTIIEKCRSLGNSFDWMNPYRKSQEVQREKQNRRYKLRMQTSKSELEKGKLDKQYEKFAKIKQRLMKYQINPESHKSILKCQKSLNMLSPVSRVSRVSQNYTNISNKNRKSQILLNGLQSRKQSNFSAFVKKSTHINQQFKKDSFEFKRIRAHINYTKIQKNIQANDRKYYRNLKTEISTENSKISNSKLLKNGKMDQKNRYFALTEVDI